MSGTCDSVTKLLSPYVDDELSGPDRAVVDEHLKGCATCPGRLADLRATTAAMSAYFTAQADAAQFAGFSQRVLAQIKKESLPLGQRARVWWTELMAYHASAIYSGFGAAAVAAAVMLFAVGSPAPVNNQLVVHGMSVADPHYEPVVMHTDDGESVIMMVEHEDVDDDGDGIPDSQEGKGKPTPAAEPPHGGNL